MRSPARAFGTVNSIKHAPPAAELTCVWSLGLQMEQEDNGRRSATLCADHTLSQTAAQPDWRRVWHFRVTENSSVTPFFFLRHPDICPIPLGWSCYLPSSLAFGGAERPFLKTSSESDSSALAKKNVFIVQHFQIRMLSVSGESE